jgi:cell wall-associated NlpC family hydrolase
MITKKMRLSMAVVALAGSVFCTSPAKADTKKEAEKSEKTEKNAYAKKAIADISSKTTLNIRKNASTESKIIGKMKRGNIAEVIKKGAQWSQVKSGNAKGYVKNEYLVFGEDAENFAKKNVKQVAKVKTETLRVRKKASTDSEIMTLVSEGETYRVKKETPDWVKVRVDGKTGYVSKDYTKVSYAYGKAKTLKELQAEKAKKQAAARKNTPAAAASGETVSTTSAVSSSTGNSIVSYAKQFVGNPYRYGGNSLTNGIDCSGFTQQVMAKFGYHISRTSSSQANEGIRVSTGNLRAGDLLFYGDGGGINHVAMYIGGGQVVHASNSAPYPKGGIKISSAFYRTPVCARRIIR